MHDGAIRVARTGGPEVLVWGRRALPTPGPGEVLLIHRAVGVNFIDNLHRSGAIPHDLPFTPGLEAAGVVEAVGPGVEDLTPGDRVGYCTGSPGAYAEARVIAADLLIPLPDDWDFEQAAASLLKGLTVEYLIRRVYPVEAGDTVLFHAAAGGVGLIACQWLKHLGATVIGTVGSEEKAALAKAHGCDHTILYRSEDIAARVRDLTDGKGVPVVYDSIGATTLEASLDSLAWRGILACFGAASGPPRPVEARDLQSRGSLFYTRPSLAHYAARRDELLNGAEALFDVVRQGLVVEINQRFPLPEAAEAHRALEARRTTGSTVLTC